MEGMPSPRNTDNEGLLWCWGCLKLKLPWSRSRRTRSRCSSTKQRISRLKAVGGFKYDPLSYAQNFDEGFDEDDEEYTQRGFSARYAAPAPLSKSLEDK
ncbi:uncharacterized protein LOC125422859 [Ziziphus jujuba]|uniref:Uncharacterized protein LOC125422859 n=1 Tax=Ziziphus jujuba TaxID=326968 RepID=A0ABM3ILL4_ZIZJJ|nr:uncharacterized protein LOC125422859 [Ziziphus jujuba]